MLIIDETWLFVNGGAVWVDNLYLRVVRHHKRLPSVAFITAGKAVDVHVTLTGPREAHDTNALSTLGLSRSDIFATNVTFQGDPHGTSATAVTTSIKQVSVYIDGASLNSCLCMCSPLTLNGCLVCIECIQVTLWKSDTTVTL